MANLRDVMKRLVATAFMLFATTSCANPQERSNVSDSELRVAKNGRVVDSAGHGVADVFVVVNWRTSSSGLPGFTSAGTWCDLQRVAVTNESGDFRISDVSSELPPTHQGTKTRSTSNGTVSITHDSDWTLVAIKPGYVRESDLHALAIARTPNSNGVLGWPTRPDTDIKSGSVQVRPVVLRQNDLTAQDTWIYDRLLLTGTLCTDSMARDRSALERATAVKALKDAVRSTPCEIAPESVITPEALGAFVWVSHGRFDLAFFQRVKQLQGLSTSGTFDPTERVTTTAGVLCRALHEEKVSS